MFANKSGSEKRFCYVYGYWLSKFKRTNRKYDCDTIVGQITKTKSLFGTSFEPSLLLLDPV